MADPAALIRTTQAMVADLADLTAAELVAMWDELGSWSDPDLERFATRARPMTTATATASARAQAALLAGLEEIAPPTLDLVEIVDDALLRLREPFAATWHAASVGRPWTDAVGAGRSTADAVGRDIAWQSSRAAMAQASETVTLGDLWKPSRYQQRPTAYQRANWDRPAWPTFVRVVSGTSCRWCQMVASRDYYSAESATFGHNRCDCMVVPKSAEADEINRKILADTGYSADQVTADMARYSRRESLTRSAETADRRMAKAQAELRSERNPARRERLETRIQEWETKAERARDSLANL